MGLLLIGRVLALRLGSGMNNYAFIDGQNLYSGIRELGWSLDYSKFRNYLARKYHVSKAYYFIAHMSQYQHLYDALQSYGFTLVFKPVVEGSGGIPKGNVDTDLVLRAMIEYNQYDRAVLVTGDGDCYSLAQYLL